MRRVCWLKKEWIVSGSGASWCKGPEAGRDGAHARSCKKPLQGMKGQWLSGTQGPDREEYGQGRAVYPERTQRPVGVSLQAGPWGSLLAWRAAGSGSRAWRALLAGLGTGGLRGPGQVVGSRGSRAWWKKPVADGTVTTPPTGCPARLSPITGLCVPHPPAHPDLGFGCSGQVLTDSRYSVLLGVPLASGTLGSAEGQQGRGRGKNQMQVGPPPAANTNTASRLPVPFSSLPYIPACPPRPGAQQRGQGEQPPHLAPTSSTPLRPWAAHPGGPRPAHPGQESPPAPHQVSAQAPSRGRCAVGLPCHLQPLILSLTPSVTFVLPETRPHRGSLGEVVGVLLWTHMLGRQRSRGGTQRLSAQD